MSESQRILEQRALKLAQCEVTLEKGACLQVVEFLLAHEHYAVDSLYVREVIPLKQLTDIPGTPAFILGIVNVRGEIVSVVDLKIFFELPVMGLTDLTRVVILSYKDENTNMEFGILAEEVLGTQLLAESRIQEPLPTLTGSRMDFLRGVHEDGIILLDALKLLSHNKMIVNQEVEK